MLGKADDLKKRSSGLVASVRHKTLLFSVVTINPDLYFFLIDNCLLFLIHINAGKKKTRKQNLKKAKQKRLNKIVTVFVKNTVVYYSTIASFYHIWSRERAKHETVIHCSVPV